MTRFRRLVALHRSLAVVTGTVAVTAIVVLIQGGAQASVEQTRPRSRALIEVGRQLYVPGCSSCHGLDGGGLRAPGGQLRGPSLKHAGEAGAYYRLHTGRMPLASPEDRSRSARSRRTPRGEIDALVAYVGSLGDGPPIPRTSTCAPATWPRAESSSGPSAPACHSASGAGGALSYGHAAPSLQHSQPLEVGAAMRIGPGQMPLFGPDTHHARDSSTRSCVTSSTSGIPTTPAVSPSAASGRSPRAS